jgi:hypoxanthine phosphoribosyltransferase
VVIGIANGGVHPAYFAADELGAPVGFYRVQRATTAIKQRLSFARRALSISFLKPILYSINGRLDRLLGGVSSADSKLGADVSGKAVLVVDDCIDSGASVAHVRRLLKAAGAREIRIAVLSWTTKYDSMALHGVTPDHCLGRSLPCYPWSADNPEYPLFTEWLAGCVEAFASTGTSKT